MDLNTVSEELKDDSGVVRAVIRFNGMAILLASERLKMDRQVVREALSKGMVLEHLSEDIKNDRDMVWTAICSKGEALFLASFSRFNFSFIAGIELMVCSDTTNCIH